jgi:beta-N-acetylhexosaminidase
MTDDLRADVSATLLPGFEGTSLPEWVDRRLRKGLGGVCVFGPNIESIEQLKQLTSAIRRANPHAIIAIDEEGGDVTRLFYASGSPFPGNAVLGRIDDVELTESIGARVGRAVRAAGCNLDFAPDVDINSNSDNPVIGVRSFGAEPELVARHSAAWVRGIESTGVAASAKHFPGHGDTAVDSHLALPVVDRSADELRARELVPFRAAISAGTRTIMTSHILLPQLDPDRPATLSPTILQGLLREELGFDGVIVSDALDMKGASGAMGIPAAAAAAVAAGCDLLCIGTDNTDDQIADIEQRMLDAVATGELPVDRLADAAARVRALGAALAGWTGSDNGTQAESLAAAGPHDAGSVDDRDIARSRSAFTRRVDVAGWLHSAGGDFEVVRLDSIANIAVGTAPWGPFAAAHAEPDHPAAVSFAKRAVHPLSAAEWEPPPGTAPVVVIGKDNHRHEFARRAIERLRGARPVLVVDMGWPGDDGAYADIATFGGSRLIGMALLQELEGFRNEVGA